MGTDRLTEIQVETGCLTTSVARRAIARARDLAIPVRECPSPRADQRHQLCLRRHPGRWLRPFVDRGQGPHRDWFLAAVQGCPFQCGYCYVRGYLDDPGPVLPVNLDALHAELDAFLGSAEADGARVHAAHLGELIAWEPWTGLAETLCAAFADHPRTTLEIRTKTDLRCTDLWRKAGDNVVFSWTVSPDVFADRFEPGLPPARDRLAAAADAARCGARVALRLDPILLVPGWQEAYVSLAADMGDMFGRVKPAELELGLFRCSSDAARVLEKGPAREILAGELLPCADGKLRYFWPLRVEAYVPIARALSAALGPSPPPTFCMEPDWLIERVVSRIGR